MDFASLIGLILCGVIIVVGIMTGQSGPSVLFNFYDLPAFLIAFGGSFCCALIMSTSPKAFLNNIKSFKLVLKAQSTNEEQAIEAVLELSNLARKNGILSLDEIAHDISDEYLKKGVLLIVDGTDPELVRNIMENDINCLESRHSNIIHFWDTLANIGPAWGMIGTLIGLINMLKQMRDVTTIGPNMSVALVTTFYGAILANWICIPISAKLKAKNAREVLIKEVMLEGVLSIQAGENPRITEEKLKSFLSTTRRKELMGEGGDEIG